MLQLQIKGMNSFCSQTGTWHATASLSLILRVERASFPPEFLHDPVMRTGQAIEQKTSLQPMRLLICSDSNL